MAIDDDITRRIIGFAIEVHRTLGPGLLESAYEACPCHELNLAKVPFKRQVPLPVLYKGIKLDCGSRMDLVVQAEVVVEVKTVEQSLPIHEAQLLTYLEAFHAQARLALELPFGSASRRN
jgi:GxxExxY protein